MDQSQPTVSRHLKLLEEIGLIKSRRDGNRTLYRVVDDKAYNVIDGLDDELVRIIFYELISKLVTI